ncbi:MAG: C4-dicarboxylate ABC transporter substrate-binding protein, partial [Hyphomicrobiaceae bacterium]
KGLWDGLSDEDKQHFLEAAKVAVKANRDRIDQDEKNGVAHLRSQGMEVIEDVDRSAFQKALEPVFAELSKKFGEENIKRIRDYK